MKFSKFCFTLATAVFAAGAFAGDALNVLVSFWSTNDRYADGTKVLPGEWYALCWSPNAEFGGITYDFKPAVEGDIIFDMMPRAKVYEDGNVGCKFTVFQADSDLVKEGGNYFVYLLDTRNAEGTDVAKVTTNNDGVRIPDTSLNGVSVSGSYTAEAALGQNTAEKSDVVGEADVGAWSESTVPADTKKPRIVDFKFVDNATVQISVADMVPGIKYNVKMGSTPSTMTNYSFETPKTVATDDETVPFEISASDASFFQVVRQPIKIVK